MKQIYDTVAVKCSRITTKSYSTSFSLGISFLNKRLHDPIYSIYGFVRFADEIVDTFHDYDKKYLLDKFRKDTYEALDLGISLNPILHSFQTVVHKYGIEIELIDTFMDSMEMDLSDQEYSAELYEKYILGSAEVVGLMCLRVFCEGDRKLFDALKPSAMKLGAAFQKVNFLRDVKADKEHLGRTYFPNVDLSNFTKQDKNNIENEIRVDFKLALEGIKKLPKSSRKGVYLAYYYYIVILKKISNVRPERVMNERIRINNVHKIYIMIKSIARHKLNRL